jgi:hypothetical protein
MRACNKCGITLRGSDQEGDICLTCLSSLTPHCNFDQGYSSIEGCIRQTTKQPINKIMNYYIITEKCRDGDHEYYTDLIVKSDKTQAEWDDNWQDLFLCWQYTIDLKDADGLWSDNRIVSIQSIREITEQEAEVTAKITSGLFTLEEIFEEGKENWDELNNQ